MTQIPLLVHALASQPLAMEDQTLHALIDVFRRKLLGASFNGEQLHAETGIVAPAARKTAAVPPTVAVVRVWGMVTHHPQQSLGTSVDQIGQAFDAAMASPQVDAILFDVDSPGGTVQGVPELAAKIRSARGVKPMTALANGMMASAAYWIGSAADEVVAIPSATGLGSIGVYRLHEDWSQKLEREGVKITAISAGKYKTEGAPWGSLSAETEQFYRNEVEAVYSWFVKDVAMQRGASSHAEVRNGYGEGRLLRAHEARKANLADRVDTWEGTVARLGMRAQRMSRGPRADVLARRLALDVGEDVP